MRLWPRILNDSWKLKWSSGDALLTSYFRKAPAWNSVWSNHETWRKSGNGIGKGKLGLEEEEVGYFFPLSVIYIILDFCFFFDARESLVRALCEVVIF